MPPQKASTHIYFEIRDRAEGTCHFYYSDGHYAFKSINVYSPLIFNSVVDQKYLFVI